MGLKRKDVPFSSNASTLAPLLIRSCTTEERPFRAARCIGLCGSVKANKGTDIYCPHIHKEQGKKIKQGNRNRATQTICNR